MIILPILKIISRNYSCSLSCGCYMPHPLFLLHPITLIGSSEALKSGGSSLCSLLQPSATFSYLGPNILFSILFSNTLIVCSSLNVRSQVSHPYKWTGKIIALNILVLNLFDRWSEDESEWQQLVFPRFNLLLICSRM
jgi:hypothetical protein